MKHKIKLLFLLLLCSDLLRAQAQPAPAYECFTEMYAPGVGTQQPVQPSFCDYLAYMPDSLMPIRYIPIRFVVVQKDDGTWNFDANSPQQVLFLQRIAAGINQIFGDVKPPVWPLPNVQYKTDTRLRFELKGITYVRNSYHWKFRHEPENILVLCNELGVNPFREINIFFCEDSTQVLGGAACQVPQYALGAMGGKTQHVQAIVQKHSWLYFWGGGDPHVVAANVAHELGHTLGLPHTFECLNGGTMSGDYFADTPMDPQAWFGNCCCPTPYPGYASNNLMGYAVANWNNQVSQRYLSPMQMAYMHANLAVNPYVRQYPVIRDFCTLQTSQTITVTGHEVWSTDRYVQGDVVVKPGASLQVNSCARVYFPPGGRLIVEPGGELWLNSGMLTTNCTQMWAGVEVWGNPGLPQTPANQGRVRITDGGSITDAQVGISTSRRDRLPNGAGLTYVWSHTGGGIVDADNAVFRSCRRAVEFMRYANVNGTVEVPNVSRFNNVMFLSDAFLRDVNDPAANSAFVTLWDVRGIPFSNCEFRNFRYQIFPSTTSGIGRRGVGIISLDAGYSLEQCRFYEMSKGIEFSTQNPLNGLTLMDSYMTDVTQGWRITGGSGHSIRNNNLQYDNGKYDATAPYHVAGSWNGISNSVIEGNSMGHLIFNQAPAHSFSLVAGSSGINVNCYDNYFAGAGIGFQTERDNAALQFTCNDFKFTQQSLRLNPLTTNGIMPQTWICTGASQLSYNNRFLDPCPEPVPASDIAKYPVSLIQYAIRQADPFNPEQPCVSTGVDLFDCPTLTQNDCTPMVLVSVAITADSLTILDQAITAHRLLYDGGMTDALVQEARQGHPQLRSHLMGAGTLSDELLEVLIRENQSLSGADLYALLLTQLPLSAGNFRALEARAAAWPAAWMQTIRQGQGQTGTPAALLRSQGLQLEQRRGRWEAALRGHWVQDPALVHRQDLKQRLLLQPGLQYRRELIPLLIETGQTAAAHQALNALPPYAELDAWRDLQGLMLQLKQSQRQVYQLNPAQLSTVRSLAQDAGPEGEYCRSLLHLVYGEDFYFVPEEPLPAAPQKQADLPETAPALPRLHPNPAHETAEICGLTGPARLMLCDVQGRVLRTWELPGGADCHSLLLRGLASGLYMYYLEQEGLRLPAQKLLID